MSSDARSNPGERGASPSRQTAASPAGSQTGAVPPEADALALILARLDRLDGMRESIAEMRLEQASTDRRIGDILERLGQLERVRDNRAPSPDTMFPPAARREAVAPVRFSAQDVRSGTPPIAAARLPPHMLRPDVSISRIPTVADGSVLQDRSLSQRILQPGIPDSDRIKVLEEDFDDAEAQGGRKTENDDLWRTAYSIVRRETPGLNRAETFKRVKEIVDEQALKAAASGTPNYGAQRKKPEHGERRINLSGIQKIEELGEDNYDAWLQDIWSFLQSNPKARDILFRIGNGPYDLGLDEELSGLIGLTVKADYKNRVLRKLRMAGETRGTVYLEALTIEANRNSESRKNLLRQKLLLTTQKSNEGIQAYADRQQEIARQLANIDDSLTDHDQVNFLLKGLHPSLSNLRDALYASQAASRGSLHFNDVVSFLRNMEEMRSLGAITSAAQPLGRFGARLVAAESVDEQLDLSTLDEEEAHALVSRFHRDRQEKRNGPPANHPQAAEWFPGACDLCGNSGHKEVHCKLRARLLDGTGPGTRYQSSSGRQNYERKPAARAAEADAVGEIIDPRIVHNFPRDDDHDKERPAARAARVLSPSLH